VPKIGAATLVGLIVSLGSILLGMGTKGLAVFVKFVLPALLVDLAGALFPAFVTSMLACVLVGAGAAALRVLADTGLGSLAIPSVVRRLRKNGLIDQGTGMP